MSKILTIVMTEEQYILLMKCVNNAEIQEEDQQTHKTMKQKVSYAWKVAPRTPGSRK